MPFLCMHVQTENAFFLACSDCERIFRVCSGCERLFPPVCSDCEGLLVLVVYSGCKGPSSGMFRL